MMTKYQQTFTYFNNSETQISFVQHDNFVIIISFINHVSKNIIISKINKTILRQEKALATNSHVTKNLVSIRLDCSITS